MTAQGMKSLCAPYRRKRNKWNDAGGGAGLCCSLRQGVSVRAELCEKNGNAIYSSWSLNFKPKAQMISSVDHTALELYPSPGRDDALQ